MKNLFKGFCFILVISLTFIISGPAFGEGHLVISIREDPDTLDPHGTIMGAAQQVMALIYDRLVYIDDDGMPQGWLAETWEVRAEGLEVWFKIREGTNFHDETPVNAEAVAFTFNRLVDPETAAPAKDQIGTLYKVEVVDDYEVVFYFEEPYSPLFSQLSYGYMGILPPHKAEEQNFGRNPIGSGPMKFSSWTAGSHIELVRNNEYQTWREDVENKGPFKFERMTVRVISEAGTRMAALEAGELHITDAPLEEMDYIEESPHLRTMIWKDSTDFSLIEFNPYKPPFDDLRMRKAVGYATNNEEIVFGALAGYATLNWNPMPTGVAGHDHAIGEEYGFHFDPEKAISLMEEAGYKDTTGDGFVDVDGDRLEVNLWTYSVDTAIVVAEIISNQLQQVGLYTNLEVLELGIMISRMRDGDHNFNYMRWGWSDPVILSLMFKTPGWTGMYSNQKLDEILEQAERTLDPEKRLGFVREAQIELLKDAAVVPLYTEWIITAYREKVEGLRRDRMGQLLYFDVTIH